MSFIKKENIIVLFIILFLSLNIFRSLSLDLDGSSGSNLCVKLDPKVKNFLLYKNGELHEYLKSKEFVGELQLVYVNTIESNVKKNIYYISAYIHDSDYYEGQIRTWIVNDVENPTLIYDVENKIYIGIPEDDYKLLDYSEDSAFKTTTECTRVEKFLYEQRN